MCARNHKTFTVILLRVGLSTSKLNEQERFVIPAHFGNHSQSHDSCELLVRDEVSLPGHALCGLPAPIRERRVGASRSR
eukprot:4121484-Prymnesium_polylepis.1